MAEARERSVYTARGPVEGEDWDSVATALNERMAARRIGQQELATLSGISVSTLRQLQHTAGRRVQNKTLTAISRALGWPENHLSAVLLGARRPVIAPGETRRVVSDQVTAETLRTLEAHLGQISERLAAIEEAVFRGR